MTFNQELISGLWKVTRSDNNRNLPHELRMSTRRWLRQEIQRERIRRGR